MRAVSGHQDLPGYSPTQETEALGLLAVQAYLVRNEAGRFGRGYKNRPKSPTSIRAIPVACGARKS
jgi:hypothetical protein